MENKDLEIKDLEELKKIQLGIMKNIHAFCVKHNLRYYLAYGTLIGAMRHNGFIPWDDDIDIFMPRNDYEIFLKEFKEFGAKHNLEVCNAKTQTFYCRPMSKVIDLNTILIEPEYKYDDPIGVFVDIWPLDGISDNPNERAKEKRKLLRMRFLLYKKITRFSFLKRMRDRLLAPFCYLFVNHKKIANKMDSLLTKYDFDKQKNVVCVSFPSRIMLREWFDNPQLIAFEDTKLFIPSHYDEILTCSYGNWRTLPPENERTPHHVINTWRKDGCK